MERNLKPVLPPLIGRYKVTFVYHYSDHQYHFEELYL